jgi:Dolichyl-phosphate-mannose-protein mannosyltransferase
MPSIETRPLVDESTSANESVSLREALILATTFALVKLILQVGANLWEAHLGWGYFRDEMYYILCGQHLDWGYVDHGPIVALQARAAVALFGRSLAGIRMFSALAGAAKLFLTGMITWALGGRRVAQALAMLGVLLAPEFLALDSFLSMNSFEPVFWMSAVFALLMLLRDGSQRWWWVFALAAGLGMENKPSMLVFLIALLIGLLLTPQRRLLFSRGAVVAIVVAGLMMVPNVLWQLHHHWPTLEFIRNGKLEHKNVMLSPLGFLHAQEMMLNPLAMPLWVAGLAWLLLNRAARPWRFLGWSYVAFLFLMMASGNAKDYYLAPVYPMLFAAGGACWQTLLARRRTRWIVPTYALLLTVSGILVAPMVLPVLTPQTWLDYTQRTHLRGKAGNTENQKTSDFPQFYADRFGWQEEVDQVTRIYDALPAADRARAGIFCSNYGEASAINFLGAGRGLPFAISGHNSYWLWGPHGVTGDVFIAIVGDTPDELRQKFDSVEIVGRMQHPYAMPYENRNIYLCRHPKPDSGVQWSTAAAWLREKKYI